MTNMAGQIDLNLLLKSTAVAAILWLLPLLYVQAQPQQADLLQDNYSDTWVAADALGRSLPTVREVGPPRTDRTVALFYFLWHGAHIQGGPYDVNRILADDPEAMRKPDSPRWGPLHAPHHWGESIFSYYLTRDEGVLRKHAQMLSDAGVDVVIFDVTNQITYRDDYMTLLRVWSECRAQSNRTPQVAFLTPFWDPAKVVRELWRDLYSPGLFPDLWFLWEGRPLILADAELLDSHADFAQQDNPAEIKPGQTLGHIFATDKGIIKVGGRFPTWNTAGAAVTLTLYRGGTDGEKVASQRFENVADNAWLMMQLKSVEAAGTYYLEASDSKGKIGWWSHTVDSQPKGQATTMRQKVTGDRTLRLAFADEESAEVRRFFTFRKPQPDYFQGPNRPDMWSWLEVFPQHVFLNARGEKEQMSVGVAQNAVGNRLGSMSEPDAKGRSWHGGSRDQRQDAVLHGMNFQEQWDHALRQDPRLIFVTGWNEWIAGRFKEFNGVKLPVMFVDQFDQEHSRDIEPMVGGHGDNYYYQLAANIRRYKGTHALPPVKRADIRIDGQFDEWRAAEPEFRDTIADPTRREHRGWDPKVTYRNDTGRNDIVSAKVSFNNRNLFCHVRTRDPLTPPADARWMLLFLDVDGCATNGWLGYDYVINLDHAGILQRHTGPGFRWTRIRSIPWKQGGKDLEMSVPWKALGFTRPPAVIDFKWADNLQLNGDWSDFTLNGDAAPNDRFNYRAHLDANRSNR